MDDAVADGGDGSIDDGLGQPDAGDDDGGPADTTSQDAGGDDDGADAGTCVDLDHDGFCRESDCDDRDARRNPSAAEVCGNATDDNCDGSIDENCLTGSSYYVDKDSRGGPCSDNGPGTMAQPWCTVAKANATLRAGDTVYLREGVYEETIQPANSGNADTARITYLAYGGERVTFQAAVYCVRLTDRSFITVRGIRFYNCQRNLYLSNSHHNNIIECEFDTPAGPATWAGSRIYGGSSYNRVVNCVFSRYGNESASGGDYQDNGCVLDIGNDNQIDRADHNLVEGNTFFYGGHHILGVYSNFNLVRRNTFHNEEWYTCHRTEIGGLCGNRNVILNTSFPEENTRNLLEENYIVFSGVPPDQVASAGLAVRTQFNIVRRNIFYENDSSGVALSADGGNSNDASRNYIYHNVFYRNGYMLLDDWNPRKNGLMLARWVDDAEHNPMIGVAIKNNLFHQNNLQAISYYYVNPAEQKVEGNWEQTADPLLVDLAGQSDPFDFTVFDFRLRPESPCIDNGVFLTRTTNSGSASTRLQVEDAGYFSDGHGLVAGDLIQLEGQTAVVEIAAIDYGSNTLTLKAPLDWKAGDGVGLPYFGLRPDQGAYEYGP